VASGNGATITSAISGAGDVIKSGSGTLTLSNPGNSYTLGSVIQAGTLDLAAVGAAGPGGITFAGKATLKVENVALSRHVFGNPIDFFAKRDVLDLTGLKFHPGATATYHKASHHLTVHSGHVTDTLTLFSLHGTHFTAANDGHGGTKVTLDSPPHTVAVASLSPHDLGDQQAAADLAASTNHLGDFLFVG
jgi:autotransporter-associated beta strand protein